MKLCAVIVETRLVPDLENIIQRHMDFLPEDTDLHIWVGGETFYLTRIFKNVTFKLINDNTFSIEKYNQLLTSVYFWDLYLKYDRVLIFQSDSVILKKGVDEYYEYDYVGSPWAFQIIGGNGGFSLRNPEVMKRICEEYKYDVTHGQEDTFFCNLMHNKKIGKLAPREICETFGCEAIFRLGTFGAHDIETWLSEEECNKIKKQYLEK